MAKLSLHNLSRILSVVMLASCGVDAQQFDADDSLGMSRQSLTTEISLLPFDTWASRTPVGTYVDRGKSCELQVSYIGDPDRRYILLKPEANLPPAVCATLVSARLRMKTGQTITGPLRVAPAPVLSSWTPGNTGASSCASCNIASGSPATFTLPAFGSRLASQNVANTCTWYEWNVTSIVQGWCSSSAYGILLLGEATGGVVSFHSYESPNRPELVVTY